MKIHFQEIIRSVKNLKNVKCVGFDGYFIEEIKYDSTRRLNIQMSLVWSSFAKLNCISDSIFTNL